MGTHSDSKLQKGIVSSFGDDLISLLDEWAAEDPAYDEETLPALKENLDHNRPEYRQLFGRGQECRSVEAIPPKGLR